MKRQRLVALRGEGGRELVATEPIRTLARTAPGVATQMPYEAEA